MIARTAVLPYWLETLLTFKVCWVLLVVGKESGILPARLLLAFSVARHATPARSLGPVLVTAMLGACLDLLFTAVGLFAFPGNRFPLWLLVLWLSFAHALHHALGFLRRWPAPLVALFGAACGPASYFLGCTLGVVEFPLGPARTAALLAVAWALLVPLALWLAEKQSSDRGHPLALILLGCTLAMLPLTAQKADAADERWRLHGEARMSVFFRPLYDIRLYTSGNHVSFHFPSDNPYKLELHYRLDIPAATLLRETLKQWQERDVDIEPHWIDNLASALPSVRSGDRLTLEVAGDGATLLHNGVPGAHLHDMALVEAFTGIWLAADTTEPELRRKLLGNP